MEGIGANELLAMMYNVDMNSVNQAATAILVVKDLVVKEKKDTGKIEKSIYPTTTVAPQNKKTESPAKVSNAEVTEKPKKSKPEREEDKIEAKEANDLVQTLNGLLKVSERFTDRTTLPEEMKSLEYYIRLVYY